MNAEAVWDQLARAVTSLLPSMIAGVLGLVVGLALVVLALVVAKAIELALRAVLTRLRVDSVLHSVGVVDAWDGSGCGGRRVMWPPGYHVGDEVEIRGERGVLRSITPTQTLLERNGRIVSFSNSVFLDETVRQ